jgi:hypothetical protein
LNFPSSRVRILWAAAKWENIICEWGISSTPMGWWPEIARGYWGRKLTTIPGIGWGQKKLSISPMLIPSSHSKFT